MLIKDKGHKLNITIRTYQENDVEGFYEAVIASREQIGEWLPWCNDGYSIEDTENWIKTMIPKIWDSKKGYEFVIADMQKEIIVGGCCLEQIDYVNKEASIGYWVRTSETKKGIATLASHFLLKFGFEELNLERIKIILSVDNIASRAVAEKSPYEKIEIIRSGFKVRERQSDALVYHISKQSYKMGIKK